MPHHQQPGLTSQILRTRGELEALRAEWSELAGNATAPSLYSTPEWFLTWWDSFATPGMHLAVVAVRMEGHLIGIAPFMIKKELFLGLPTTSIEFISMSRYADDPLCIPGTLDFIVASDHEIVLREIWRSLPALGRWDMLRLHPVPSDSPVAALFTRIVSELGHHQIRRDVDVNYHIHPSSSVEEYLAGLHRSFHDRIAAKHRQLLSDPRARFSIIHSPDELPAGFDTIIRIENESWKARTGIPIVGPGYRDFFPAFAREAAMKGWLRIGLFEYDGIPIAYEYAVAYKGRLEMFKGSYDERKRKLSPGRILGYDLILRSLRSDIIDINLFSGEAHDKLKWKPVLHPFMELFVFNRTAYAHFLEKIMFGAEMYTRKRYIRNRVEERRRERYASLPHRGGTVAAFAAIAWEAFRRKSTRHSLASAIRRRLHGQKVIHSRDSGISGKLEVVDIGRERQLVISNQVASLVFTRGSWNELRKEYWGVLASPPFPIPRAAEVLLVGLGGGTVLRLLKNKHSPSTITVIELDPAIVETAREFFGLAELRGVEVIEEDALKAVERLFRSGTRFDYIIDDVFFEPGMLQPNARLDLWRRYVSLLKPGGGLAINTISESRDNMEKVDACVQEFRKGAFEVRMKDLKYISPNRIFFVRPTGGVSRG